MLKIDFSTYQKYIISNLYQSSPLNELLAESIGSCTRLNKNGKACQFFGVDCRENIQQKLGNHINLALLKSQDAGILSSFPGRVFLSVDRPNSIYNAWNNKSKYWLVIGI